MRENGAKLGTLKKLSDRQATLIPQWKGGEKEHPRPPCSLRMVCKVVGGPLNPSGLAEEFCVSQKRAGLMISATLSL